MKNKITLDYIILFLFKGLVVILPLFFLPWTASRLGMDNFNKDYLLWILIPLIFFLWLGKSLKQGEFKFIKTFFNIPIILLLAVYGLAAFFSLDAYSSVFGSYGVYTNPLLTFVSIVLLYFFTASYFKARDIIEIIKAVILSFFAVVFFTLILFIGSWIFNLGSDSLLNQFFVLSAGSFEDLAIYLAVINIFIIGILFNRASLELIIKKNLHKLVIIFFLCLSFFFLLMINFPPAWWLVLAGLVFLFLVNNYFLKNKFRKRKNLIFYLVSIILLLGIILINIFIVDNNVFANRRTAKLQLDFNNSYSIAKEAVKNKPFLGYGSDTFPYVFSLHRDASINNTDYWYLRFNKPAAYIFELIITTGIVGTLSYLFFILFYFYLFYNFLDYFASKYKINTSKEAGDYDTIAASLMAPVLLLLIGQFFIMPNIVLIFLFWLFLSLLALIAREISRDSGKKFKPDFNLYKINKTTNPDLFNGLFLLIFLLAAGWIILFSFEVKYWVAEAFYNKAEAGEYGLQKAVNLNPGRFNYKITLAKYCKEKAITELEETGRDIKKAGNLVNNSIDWARQSVKEAPFSIIANEALGIIYRDIGTYSKDNQVFAIKAFREAKKLEPTNPVLSVELGKLYLETGAIVEAVSVLEEANNLKNNYFEAEFNLAKAYSQSGKEYDALMILDKIVKEQPSADVFYEQGRIYYNIGNFDMAINNFEEVLDIVPNHSNALYSIGLAFEGIGEKDRALDFFKKVLDLNPENKEIMEKIESLEEED
ncbi:hypothetical protein DRH27_02595 [Candidatus Falkowbacteria bacterium]|nr:MAG: hypothetical protein DRH27_02595 [Candidatus Falkowbacteria bacterium]